MRRLFSRLSIRNKLIWSIFLASGLVSLSGFIFIFIVDSANLRANTINTAKSQVRVLSQDFVKVLLFDDINLTADVVSKLRAFPTVKNAFIYNQNSKVIFSFHQSPQVRIQPPTFVKDDPFFDNNFLHFYQKIEYAGSEYGRIYLRISPDYLNEKLNEYYGVLAVGLPTLLILSYILAVWLQRFFSTPLLNLTREMAEIAENRDYSVKLKTNEKNEIGSLYKSFNSLLEEILNEQSQLALSEKRLAGVLDIAGSAIISIDDSQKIIIFNRHAETIFGYKTEEIIGQSIELLMPGRFRANHQSHVDEFPKQSNHVVALNERAEISGLRKNGEEFPVEAAISWMEFEGRHIFTVALNDISERKHIEYKLEKYRNSLEHQVEQRTAELQAKNQELEAFSYSIAHDLKAPLRTIKSFSQIILEDCQDDLNSDGKDYFERIIIAGSHMSNLIDDLLKLSRIGRSKLEMRNIDLSNIAQRIAQRLDAADEKRKTNWKIQEALTVNADPNLMEIALDNLMSNAWKYTGRQANSLIELGVIHNDNDDCFYIKDNGIGFDMQYAKKLFIPFHRLHHAKEFEGTGIGLATVHRIVQRHNGRVWASAELDKGATFYFSLPKQDAYH